MALDVTGSYRYPNPDAAWLAQRVEDILEPDLPIIDPHHHIWKQPGNIYGVDDLKADVSSGHRVIATVFVHKKTLEEAFFPVVVVINTIPVVAKAPILVLLLGNGMEPKIAIAALICFFPTLVNMVRGLESVNPQAMELMRVLSASKREVFFKLRLPHSLPYLFSALKIAASTAVIGAIVGEWIGSTLGIGALIIQATYAFDSALLYATVIVGSCFSMSFFLLISLIESLALRQTSQQNS